MVLKGAISIENLGAIRLREVGVTEYSDEDGNVYAKKDYVVEDPGEPEVRLGDTIVPARVAYSVLGADGSPTLRAEFELRDGTPVCTSLHVDASEGGRGILTGDLTTIRDLRRMAEDAFLGLARRPSDTTKNWRIEPDDAEGKMRAKGDLRGDAILREVARIYKEYVNERPVEAVMEILGFESRRTTERWIKRARDREYLPKTSPGRKKAFDDE